MIFTVIAVRCFFLYIKHQSPFSRQPLRQTESHLVRHLRCVRYSVRNAGIILMLLLHSLVHSLIGLFASSLHVAVRSLENKSPIICKQKPHPVYFVISDFFLMKNSVSVIHGLGESLHSTYSLLN